MGAAGAVRRGSLGVVRRHDLLLVKVHFRDRSSTPWHTSYMAIPRQLHPDPTAALPLARARLSPELERELRRAVEEIERGEYIELSPADLDRWADDGVSPWPDESRG